MSEWTYARIARIEFSEVHCVFCKRPLRSGRLIVLRDESGAEAYAGPACAKKYVGTPTEPILDLSKMAMMLVLKDAAQAPLDPADPTDPTDDPHPKRAGRAQAIEVDEVAHYLRLRADHMAGFTGNATQKLREFHGQLSTASGLEGDARLYVERLLAKSRLGNTIYAYRNVERCIGAAYWLRIAIDHTKPERRDFLERILRSLHENWRLTPKQIEAINRWGEGVRKNFPDFPVLDADAFDGVQAPRFAQPQNSGS